MSTKLKSIRFPNTVVSVLDDYSKKNYGISFSKYIVHLAIDKVEEINSTSISLQDIFEESENDIVSGNALILKDEESVKSYLNSLKEDE